MQKINLLITLLFVLFPVYASDKQNVESNSAKHYYFNKKPFGDNKGEIASITTTYTMRYDEGTTYDTLAEYDESGNMYRIGIPIHDDFMKITYLAISDTLLVEVWESEDGGGSEEMRIELDANNPQLYKSYFSGYESSFVINSEGRTLREECRDISRLEPEYITSFVYNEDGLLIEEMMTIGQDEFPQFYEYTQFDSVGNWTERLIRDADSNVLQTENRVIIYR